MRRALVAIPTAIGLCLTLAACKGKGGTDLPSEDEEDLFVGSGAGGPALTQEQELDKRYGKRPDLPARPKPAETCEGEGKDKACRMADPDPPLAAAHGVREFMGLFRWNMEPEAVIAQLKQEVTAEYEEKQKQAANAAAQDENRRWRDARLEEIGKRHVKFESAAKHTWGATVIQNEFEDDAGEAMVWFDSPGLNRFYFFKDGKLWKITYAHAKRTLPGKTFDHIVEDHFKKRFGYSPQAQEDRDEKTSMVKLRWSEWESRDGEHVRVFDLLEGHGVVFVSLVASEAEEKLGRRLPANKIDPALGGSNLEDTLRESGVCYDDDGLMIHDPEKCQAKWDAADKAAAEKKSKKKKKKKK